MHSLKKIKSNSHISSKNNSSIELLDKKIQKLQQKSICDELGIDHSEISKFKFFFDQIKSIKLPDHWKIKLNHQKELVYINENTNQISQTHPNINLFKIFFYQQQANKKNAETFHDKSRKLLPLIEQKLLKQFIGMASRRKEVEKINLQKNEQGKFVTNKINRIAPDTKKLMATRSYLLKGIVQKILTKKQIWGIGRRARQFSNLLQKKQQQKQQQEVQESIELVEKIYDQAAQFYQSQFGILQCVPKRLQQTVFFKLLTPSIVLKCLKFLNIQKQSIEQYWIAQIMNCLPLPPLWRRLKGTCFDEFYHQAYDIKFEIHPSIIYLAHQLNLFKSRYQKLENIEKNYYLGFRQMQFIDFFQRKYEIDIYALMEKQQRDLISQQNERIHSLKKKKSSENPKFLSAQKFIEVSNDWMTIEGVMAAEINYQDLSLIQYIEQFWKSINFTDQIWQPSVSPYGQVLWNHNINGSCITDCPYQSRLKRYLKEYYGQIKQIKPNDIKTIFNCVKQLEQYQIGYIQKNFKQKTNFLEHYLIHHGKPIPYKIDKDQFNQESYFNVIFNCPFDFQNDVLKDLQKKNQVVPLWLEKVQAKRYKQNFQALLAQTENPKSLKVIQNIVKQLYIKSTEIKQIQNLQQVKANLKQQMNKDQLIRLVNVAFDIDARQERVQKMRRKYQYVQKQQVEDLFGSSESQIDLNDRSTVEQNLIKQVSEKQSSQQYEQSSISKSQQSLQERKQAEVIKQENQKNKQNQQIKQTTVVVQIKKSAEQIKYQMLENVSQEGLNNQIKDLKNIKMKTTKYKQKKFDKKIIEKVNKVQNKEMRMHYKKNLILTNLKKQEIPNKVNLVQIKHLPKKSIIQSQKHLTNHQDSHQFISHNSNYTNSSIVNIVNKLPKKELDLNIQKIQVIKQPQESDDTHKQEDKSFYSFVNIIKQSIKDDPILKHVDQYQQCLTDFHKTFRKSISTADQSLRQSRFVTIRKILDNNKQLQSTRSHQKFTKTALLFRKIEEEKQQKQEKMISTTQNFRRKCISSTASQMLNTNAFTSRLDFQKMEIRKSLFLKHRGVRNFIA